MAETRNFPMTKNGHEIPLRTTTDHVTYTQRGASEEMTLTQKIDNVNEEAKTLNNIEDENKIKFSKKDYADNIQYKKFTIINHTGRAYMSLKDTISLNPRDNSQVWLPLSRRRKNICIIEEKLIDSKERQLLSDEGYTFDDLSAMLRNNDYYRYIQNGDYIKLVYGDGYVLTLVANIDTYYNSRNEHPHCIDFICTKIEYWQESMRDNAPVSHISYDLDPNISTNKYTINGIMPMLLKTFLGPWSLDNAINQTMGNFLNIKFTNHIVSKYKNVITRKYDKNNNTIENLKDYGVVEADLGKSWFLYEGEIKGYNGMSSINDMMTCTQYPIFQKFINRVFKFNNKYLGILTSSSVFDYDPTFFPSAERPDTSNLNMICIRNNISQIYTQSIKDQVFPMFGMRFV